MNKCKWKYHPTCIKSIGNGISLDYGSFWATECENKEYATDDQVITDYWKHCPYCGKEIEVNNEQHTP